MGGHYSREPGGPRSVNFPERVAADHVRRGILRLDPDGSLWRVRKFLRESEETAPVPAPKRIDYPTPSGHRYFEIRIEAGIMSKVMYHRLLWQLAHGDIPDGLTVNHKDGNPANNALENFELTTHSGNHLHRFRVLGQKAGAKVNADLSEGFAAALEAHFAAGGSDPSEMLVAALQRFKENRPKTPWYRRPT